MSSIRTLKHPENYLDVCIHCASNDIRKRAEAFFDYYSPLEQGLCKSCIEEALQLINNKTENPK